MGQALRGDPGTRRRGRHAVTERLSRGRALGESRGALSAIVKRVRRIVVAFTALLLAVGVLPAQPSSLRLDRGRFTVVADVRDERLARALLQSALERDTFPGLPRPRDSVEIVIARDANEFRRLVAGAPEWGSAIAVPEERRVVMQGNRAGSDAGDPLVVLRHELAHLALHEGMGRLPPRWFDEGYASFSAGEWNRESAFETSLSMVWNALPSRDTLEAGFFAGSSRAEWSYAVAHRIVSEMAALDPVRGLGNFFSYWKESSSFEVALRRAYGMTGTQFDKHWQQQTRKRYGALAIVANLTFVGAIFGLLLGPLFWMRRQRDRRKLEAMRAADAAQEQALRESALAALLADEIPHSE